MEKNKISRLEIDVRKDLRCLDFSCYCRKFGSKSYHEFYVDSNFIDVAEKEDMDKILDSVLKEPKGDPHGK